MARHGYQVTCATCHSLDASCHVSDTGSRRVCPLYASYDSDPTASPSHSIASSSFSSCFSTSESIVMPRTKKPINHRRTVKKQ
ncbi:B-box zinc finger family protein [Musa troglodytarum]|uniref:B-box zinc finger family protein n=1 Tax=Musa troglodytarum TaxID=320322 RepID=A0A9E7EAP6_9LILI|nr:B-box zinc finger family protein [Musa troglodytarum]